MARASTRPRASSSTLAKWLRTQALNVSRHAGALHPFRSDEFAAGSATPTDGHIKAANDLMAGLRRELFELSKGVGDSVVAAVESPTPNILQSVVRTKEAAHRWVQAIERIWDFYFELFGQRQSRFGEWLVGCDRIALDCYQSAFVGLGRAKSIPAPAPFSYMRTGFSPATWRRGVPLRKLGKLNNPFPLVQLPYHRLVNPWTLGAILHEVSHNLHNELGLARTVPRNIAARLLDAGFDRSVAAAWVRWNREAYADLLGLLLGGPAIVASLMDVVGRSPRAVLTYSETGPHPTPYVRTLLSVELLRRMGFADEADRYRRAWTRIYPNPRAGTIPKTLLDTLPQVLSLVVDTVCFQRYAELGNKSLSEVISFAPKEQQMVEEAAARLAAGSDPGIVPERFLIGAARVALDRRLARPGTIAENFYKELARR